MVAFDVGAYVGELTLLFARLVGDAGMVHAFEANPTTFDVLRTVCDYQGRTNIKLNPIAVGETSGEVTLNAYPGAYASWSSRATRPLKDYGIEAPNPVPTVIGMNTLDGYCDANSISRIDLLKLDIEGAELQALRGATALLSSRLIQCCILEVGQTVLDMGNRPEEIQDLLESAGYRVRNVIDGQPVIDTHRADQSLAFAMLIAEPR